MDRRPVVLAGLASLLLCVTAGAPHAQPARPDISGAWLLRYDGHSVPEAHLVAPRAMSDEQVRAHDAHAIRWCNAGGLPAFMDTGGVIDVIQGRDRVSITNDSLPSQARHIYLDVQHPDAKIFDNQVVGHSVGHWDGEALVVDTVGFSGKGLLAIPGGGWRTENSQLAERYQLLPGDRLRVTFTWTDPGVFQAPHTYVFTYVRAPAETNFATYRCDSSDEDRAALLERGSK